MDTPEAQQAFFRAHWPALREALAAGGAEGVRTFLDGFPDARARRVLAYFARQGLLDEPADRRGLDALTALGRAATGEILAQAEAAEDDASRAKAIDLANVITYNLSADLADCWPGEGPLPRGEARFTEGLRAAEACIRWREELGKGPGPRSMAWWAKGMHQLSLGRIEGAVTSFERSLAYAKEDAPDETSFGVVLGKGYAGLARWRHGEAAGHTLYEEALAAFRAQQEDEATRDDAAFGIAQLETVRKRYLPEA